MRKVLMGEGMKAGAKLLIRDVKTLNKNPLWLRDEGERGG
jgi:hypothetical protein